LSERIVSVPGNETPRQTLERMGEARVRVLYPHGLAQPIQTEASAWLAERDEAREAKRRRYKGWMLALAIIGAIAAVIAAVTGILALR
jgi:hypothetical protein